MKQLLRRAARRLRDLAIGPDGRVESQCACCGEPVTLEVQDGALVEGAELLVHILVPAREWWSDIGFT